MQDVVKLFNDMNIDIDEKQKLYFKEVKVDVMSNTWEVYLHAKNLISSDYYEEIYTKFTKHFKTNKVVIKIFLSLENSYFATQEKSRIIGHYERLVRVDSMLNSGFKDIEVEVVNHKLIFDVKTEFDKSIINRNLPTLDQAFKNLGLTNYEFDYHVKIMQNNEEMEKLIAESEAKITAPKVEAGAKKFKKTQLFGDPIEKRKVQTIDQVLDPNNLLINCTIEGVVFGCELRETRKSHILMLMIFDGTATITAKAFPNWNNKPPTLDHLKSIKMGMTVKISGRKEFDRYANDETIMIESILVVDDEPKLTEREDNCENKRVELHMHTKMSRNNGVSSLDDYAQYASHFGHSAISITDHDVVQAYVEAEKIAKKYNIRVIHGLEASVVKDTVIVFNENDKLISELEFVVFDLETTGLSANFNKIIEIGAVRVRNGQVIERYQQFITIDQPVSEFTTELTGITDEDLAGGIDLHTALKDFYKWSKDSVLVAHNALFDMQFLARNYEKELGMELTQPVLDTLELSRYLNQENTYHSLKILANRYQVALDTKSHHRADYDAEKLTEIFLKMLIELSDQGIETLSDINKYNDVNRTRGFHNLIYVANQQGLRNMYEIVSDANTTDLHLGTRVLKSNLLRLKENLIYVGGGCSKSEIVDSYLNHSKRQLEETICQFDFVELLPISQYQDLINNDTFSSTEQIKQMQLDIYDICKKNNIRVVANGDVHYTEDNLGIIKEMLYAKDFKPAKSKTNEFGLEEFTDKVKFAKWQAENKLKNSNQFYRTTEEMKEEFLHFSDEIIEEIVVTNTNEFLECVEDIKIIPDDLYTPEVEGVDQKMTDMVYGRAYSIYGEKLPEIVEKRIEKELNSIIKYGFSIVYYISHKLVKHSLDNGYLVGSRGSVGSSLVATFMDITEINPLAPHYVCPKCKKSEFILDGSYGSGFDMPIKTCPDCQVQYKRDGQDIPFETFLGFEGDKVPDIDLNFSGEFQAHAHEFVRSRERENDDELFDVNHAFKAGTIGTIAEKTAYAYAKNYFDLIDKPARKTDISFYVKYLEGIKRTTGQHPGGIIVVPAHREIYEFTPIQYPADDRKNAWRTTHFDFHSIHDNLLKLDILGHDDPTMLKKLYDLTGVNPQDVDIADPKVMELFTSTDSLNLQEDINLELGTMGVPEFGTGFVMEMLKDTKPKTYAELVQISGLSHGTDVWLGNAKNLIDDGTCVLKDVIGCRDDIMVYLMYQGLEPLTAFSIMENVRKGKGLSSSEIETMKKCGVPDWYIESCQKIKYMFPKAHAAAYVLMALRIAYYKVYHPLEYYAAYFTSRIDDFDFHAMIKGSSVLKERIETVESFSDEMSDVKRKNLLNSLKMCLEMTTRGFTFDVFSLEKSQAFEFVINDDHTGLIMPFKTIEGLGEKEAIAIVEERDAKPFVTVEDFKKRTRVKKKSFETLEYYEVFDGLDIDSQMTLF